MARGTFSLDDIKEALRGGAVVWLSVGLFRLVGDSADTFERYSGHAITLVGFGVDENGRTNPNVLIVKDPDRRDDTWPNYYLRPVPLTHGFGRRDPVAQNRALVWQANATVWRRVWSQETAT